MKSQVLQPTARSFTFTRCGIIPMSLIKELGIYGRLKLQTCRTLGLLWRQQ